MKQIFTILTAGILGGLIAFAALNHKLETRLSMLDSVEETRTNAVLTSHANVPFDFTEAAELATPAVVHIYAKESEVLASNRRQRKAPGDIFDFDFNDLFGGGFGHSFGPKQGTGSGVIYSSDGYIITNNHVVGFADDIRVVLADKREYKAEKIGTDPSSDLALLKIEGQNLPTIPIGDSDVLKVGEWVLAVGNPFSYLTSTVTAGIVSAKGRDLDIIEGTRTIEEFIQTDAAVNPGNSGGALVDSDGNLIGINTAIATPTGVYAGYSFAIPIDLVTRIIEDIKVNGDIDRANLGIRGYDLDEEIAKEENLDIVEGFLIKEVDDGSGAQYSGVLPGDIVVGVEDMRVKNIEDIKRAMKFSKVGDTIKLKVLRNGKKETLRVKLRKSL